MKPIAIMSFAALAACSNSTERPYRLPYEAGTQVTITNDHRTHSSPEAEMFDMRATTQGRAITAAAPGWLREIDDTKGSNSSTNNYVWIEHPLDYCQPATPGSIASGPPPAPTCKTCPEGLGKCNEWTLYAHMERGSVAARGLSVDDWVEEGQEIATEGDVGFTPCGDGRRGDCGRHLHFAVFTIDRDATSAQNAPDDDGAYEFYAETQADFGEGRPERVPLFCTSNGLRLVRQGQTHEPGPCPPLSGN